VIWRCWPYREASRCLSRCGERCEGTFYRRDLSGGGTDQTLRNDGETIEVAAEPEQWLGTVLVAEECIAMTDGTTGLYHASEEVKEGDRNVPQLLGILTAIVFPKQHHQYVSPHT
jgi:hypothetical protein